MATFSVMNTKIPLESDKSKMITFEREEFNLQRLYTDKANPYTIYILGVAYRSQPID